MSDCDDDDDYGILKKALDVDLPADFDPNKPPQTGEEYLQHVIYERTKCQTWIAVDVDRTKFKNKQTFKVELEEVAEAPASLLPTIEWQTNQIKEFTQLRLYIQSKKMKEPTVATFEETEFVEGLNKEPPQFSDIAKCAQMAKIRMLQLISNSLDGLEKGSSVGENMGSWIYAILVLLEIPLSPNFCYTVRKFAKKCRLVRSNLAEDADEALFKPLNLFVCIIARFFNQLDLADP